MSTLLKHISLAELSELAENRPTQSDRESLNTHLSTCTKCSDTFSRLKHVFGLMRTDSSEDAPRDVIARAIGLFQPSRQEPSLLRRVLAVLSFDSFDRAPAFGTRSADSSSRQLLYAAEDNDIDLHITPKDDGWIVVGQVLGNSCENGEVDIEGEKVSYSTQLNESCEFKLPVVPSGNYRLRLRLSDIEVEVPRLELRK